MLILDYKYYKWIALLPGWLLGDWIGAISAFLLVREIMSVKENEISYELALLKLASLLIKSDGKVDQYEVSLVQKYFKTSYGNPKAKKLFNDLKTRNDVPSEIDSLTAILKKKLTPSKYYSIIQFLYSLSAADGKITKPEDDFVRSVGSLLNFTDERLNSIRNQFIKTKQKKYTKTYSPKIIECLSVLELKPGVEKSDIKSAYRRLAKEFHPDKLAGMNEIFINLAKEKFQVIQDSYEYLNKNYV